MYPIERRMQAQHVYSLFYSLRKAAVVLQVSHSTVARWLKDPTQKKYARKSKTTKTELVIDTIRFALESDPFVSLGKLRKLVLSVMGISVSKELLRTAIKCQLRYSRKKAKYFSCPANLKQKTEDFLLKKDQFISENRPFVSLDETSFGRNGVETSGYAPIGSSKGEIAVPVSRAFKECKSRFTTIPTDEFRTTAISWKEQVVLQSVNITEGGRCVRGLLWCGSTNDTVSKFVNRDLNAAINIRQCLTLRELPYLMRRSENHPALTKTIGRFITC